MKYEDILNMKTTSKMETTSKKETNDAENDTIINDDEKFQLI